MEERKALELASAWWSANAGAGGSNKPFGLRDFLALELHRVLPEPPRYGVAQFEEEPWLLVLYDDALVLAAAAIDFEDVPTANVRVVPLTPRPNITIKAAGDADHGSRQRTWSLQTSAEVAVEIITSEVISAAFSSDVRPDTGEILMRQLLDRSIGEVTKGSE